MEPRDNIKSPSENFFAENLGYTFMYWVLESVQLSVDGKTTDGSVTDQPFLQKHSPWHYYRQKDSLQSDVHWFNIGIYVNEIQDLGPA